MKRALLAVLLASAALGGTARAGVQVGAGPVDEIEGEGSVLATVAYLTEDKHPLEFIAGYFDARNDPAIHTPGTFWVSVSKRYTWNGWFAQGGVAWADADNEVLSKHWQFQTGAGYDFGRVSLSLRHLSNADTGGRNRGETFLLLDYAF